MKTITSHTNLLTTVYLTVVDGEAEVIENKIKKHEAFLNRISSGFGFNAIESSRILAEVCLQANKQYADYSGTYPFKIGFQK